jgi:hypothetical protein
MGITTVSTVVAAMAAATVALAAPAFAAPTGPGDAQQTIEQLQRQGYTVIVNRLGTAPLDESSVVAVRPGQAFLPSASGMAGMRSESNNLVYVDVQ